MERTLTIENREWLDIALPSNPIDATRTQLHIEVSGTALTENYNLFSKTVKEEVSVSAYPLAMWFLHSWWRIFYDVYSIEKHQNLLWRTSHEIASANEGFVWPKIAFVSDLKYIHIYAQPYHEEGQSVRYLNGIESSTMVSFETLQSTIDRFIYETIERLKDLKVENDLADFFAILKEERINKEIALYRKIEAQMGFDPDEAAENLVQGVIRLLEKVGKDSMDELNAAFGKDTLENIDYFNRSKGIPGNPQVKTKSILKDSQPWRQAYADAKNIRKEINNTSDQLENDILFELLGIANRDKNLWTQRATNQIASVSSYHTNTIYNYYPIKKHPLSQRFEMSRFVGDMCISAEREWLVQTDYRTARQKYQKAFAAEFLCPVASLIRYLDGDFTDDSIENASEHFQVSSKVVESQLANQGLLPKVIEPIYQF